MFLNLNDHATIKRSKGFIDSITFSPTCSLSKAADVMYHSFVDELLDYINGEDFKNLENINKYKWWDAFTLDVSDIDYLSIMLIDGDEVLTRMANHPTVDNLDFNTKTFRKFIDMAAMQIAERRISQLHEWAEDFQKILVNEYGNYPSEWKEHLADYIVQVR